ncbi:hypothetical protein B5X24_HaOG203792 [Helicoverpa armigera]|nr:hypothetical protein B5X24_HaOG203792 [Helicoverpa armigera]
MPKSPPCTKTPPCPAMSPSAPPCQRPPACPHTPPCTTLQLSSSPPSDGPDDKSPFASPSCPASRPSCFSVSSQCPEPPPPCKKTSSGLGKKISPFFKRKTSKGSGHRKHKGTKDCQNTCQHSPCNTCVPSPCRNYSATSCSFGSISRSPEAPFVYSPIHPCPIEPEKPKKAPLPCDSSPCNKRHSKNKSRSRDEYKNPNSIKSGRRTGENQQCDDFPWPTKNQISNQSSITSLFRTKNEPAETLVYGQCKKDCPMMPRLSCNTILSPEKECTQQTCPNKPGSPPMLPRLSCSTIPSPKQECKKSCPNKQGSLCPPSIPEMQCPQPRPPPAPTVLQKPHTLGPENPRCRSRIGGLSLKMMPYRKPTCSKDCPAWQSTPGDDGCISLNSEEKITIRLKKENPSTIELREGMNIKVQDEDGMTLFERKDYRLQHADCTIQRPSLLGEMFKASEVRRLTTNNSVQAFVADNNSFKGMTEIKSESSIANLIEIQFKLKVTQGEKTTEINIANDGDRENEIEDNIERSEGIKQMPQEVFVMNNEGERIADHSDRKNDLNIRIVIKNFKPKNEKKSGSSKNGDYSKDFSEKISAKFHSVSTGYSDELHDDNVFSVHRATIDLTSSVDNKSRTYSEEIMSETLIGLGRGPVTGSSEQSVCRCVTDMSEGKSEDMEAKSTSQKYSTTKDIQETLDETDTEKLNDHKYEYTEETDTEKQIKYDTEETDTEKQVEPKYDNFMSTDTDEPNALSGKKKSIEVIVKPHTKEEKKEMLKQVFEKAQETTAKTKTRMRKLRDMLRVILTSDSSDHEEANRPTNDVSNDVAYAALKPNYYTDSMNNYYRESHEALTDEEINKQVVYPTIENSDCTDSNHSDELSSDNEEHPEGGCMCCTVAARLKLASRIEGEGCCCAKPPAKKSEEVTCNLKKESDYCPCDMTPDYVDAETQKSQLLTNKMNNADLSAHKNVKTSTTASISMKEDVKSNSGVVNVNERQLSSRNTLSRRMVHVKECVTRKMTRNTTLSISDEDKIVLVSDNSTKFNDSYRLKDKAATDTTQEPQGLSIIHASDILQSYETKKAVLEIYTEKTVSDDGERLVAKLPKFVYDRENEIQTNYEAMASNTYKTVCKRNIVMMAINR